MKTSSRFIATALSAVFASALALAQTVTRVGTLPSTEIPEGIAIDADGNVYLSLETSIRRITPAGVVSTFATLPPGSPPARMTGMKFDAAGNLYACGGPSGLIWRFSRTGEPTRWATVPGAGFVNDLDLDAAGNVYASDSGAYKIYKISPAGVVQDWSVDPLLRPRATPTFFPNATVGCNGIAFGPDGALYAIMSQAGRLVRIPVNSNGSAGAAQIVAENEMLAGGDGIAIDTNGDVYIALNIQNRIVVVKPDGRWSTVAAGGQLYIPTTIAFGRGSASRSLFICNNAHFFPGGDAEKTGVLRIDLGTLADATAVRMSNVAAYGRVGPDNLVVGFTINGERSKAVIVRAIGPALTPLGVSGALTDPRLELFSGRTVIDSNDNWIGTAGTTVLVSTLGAFALPTGSRDAMVVTTLAPGSYTAQVSGVGGATGLALVEVYEVP